MNQCDEKQYEDAMAQAAKLRAQAEAIEGKERVRRRLLELMDISKDPYYDQYLKQMMKDLESGKATPGQVAKEAERTYAIYQQRMGEKPKSNGTAEKKKNTVEFKIGAGIFSILGAVFVLAALVIIGFNLLEGIWQGICLYAIAIIVIGISELAVKRLNKIFSQIITAIGISSLFVATVVNYLVLENINGIVASVITVAIALFSILFGRKQDAASIRLISVFGCYICFLPIQGFESELSFLMIMGMVFAINFASALIPNQRNNTLIAGIHMFAHVIFTAVVTGIILANNMGVMYIASFTVLSLLLVNVIFYMQRYEMPSWMGAFFSVILGIMTIILMIIINYDYGIDNDALKLTYRLLVETIVIASSVLFFVLWGQNKCRWIQYYFVTALIVFFNSFSEYEIEAVVGILLIYIITRLLSRQVKEVRILDGILLVLLLIQGIYFIGEWYGVVLLLAAVISVFTIKEYYIFNEIVLTVYFVTVALEWLDTDWTLTLCIGVLMILMVVFNYLPGLKGKKQFPYNVVNISFVGFISLCSAFYDNYWAISVMMCVGAGYIIMAFRKRFEISVPKKYLVLACYLIYMIFAARYTNPVVTSVLLMLVAIGCVTVGFKTKDKVYRIFGLVLAALVCVKLIIFDFDELETISKAILFLLVGVIALGISFLYIYLEKKDDENKVENLVDGNEQNPNCMGDNIIKNEEAVEIKEVDKEIE